MSLLRALRDLDRPVWARPDGALAEGPGPGHAFVPAVSPETFGAAAFRQDHGVSMAIVSGEMANGIAGPALVIAMARAGLLAFLGTAGLPLAAVEAQARQVLDGAPAGAAWGANLLFDPLLPRRDEEAVSLTLRLGLRHASASAYATVTPGLARWRLTGIYATPDGRVVTPNHLFAKLSRLEVARRFLEPAPAHLLQQLVDEGALTPLQARLAERVPVADAVTAEADSGGHTDRQPLLALLPSILALRDEISRARGYEAPPLVGAAGGLGTPQAVAAAFLMGADYVMTGSVNQASVEASTSALVKEMLAAATASDTAMAAAADTMELGGEVQVLRAGTLYAARSRKLAALHRRYERLERLPDEERVLLEERIFRRPLAQVWTETQAWLAEHAPEQLPIAERDPSHRMALVFRWYLGQSSAWAQAGLAARKADFQIWCGPAMGSFNAWARGGPLEPLSGRGVVAIQRHLMRGAALLMRVRILEAQGVQAPEDARLARAWTDDDE
ncbi:PfaD family polyunsaturated fatty acid/polyketide biosynthesis protein, partial [Myxococcota bacterium]|nr:PfaD family polyunsaturated fatty acid/polyketide biosynthesis protein [Myxococcota bacterium]